MKRIALLIAIVFVAVGGGLLVDVPVPTTVVSVVPAAPVVPADLDALQVKGRAPMTGYDRDLFGQRWSDDVRVEGGHNGCDTRNDILRRDLTDPQIRPGTFGCLVESGTLDDPYSGTPIAFVRGDNQLHIDHVVALADAWAKGAQAWDEDTRRDFANDPLNLLAVDAGLNQQKGAGDAATWLPPNKAFRCDYAQRIVAVKGRYGLSVTAAEKDALARELARCDGSPGMVAGKTGSVS